jgi:peptidoglycan/LPS O-acetylase OafA/YrhL
MSTGARHLQQRMAEGARLPTHIPTLDGWRALAIVAVICFHGRFEHQSINLRAFYIRRIFRIIPPYVGALAGICLVAWLRFIHLQSWEIPSCLLFLRNYEPTVAPPCERKVLPTCPVPSVTYLPGPYQQYRHD